MEVGRSINRWWKREKSEIYPYNVRYSAYEAKTGDFHIDINYPKRLVRLEICFADGRNYYAIIKSGMVIRERELPSEIDRNLYSIFHSYREVFSTVPDLAVLQAIGGAYGIRVTKEDPLLKQPYIFYGQRPKPKKVIPELYRLLKADIDKLLRKLYQFISLRPLVLYWFRIKQRLHIDLFDILVVLSIGYWVFQFTFDYCLTGKAIAFLGMATGLWDWRFRKIEPLFLKFGFLALCGGILYTYGYLVQ